MSDPLVTLERVGKTYGRGSAQTRAVVDVSMTVERGEWIAIMGPSGHGKTTLLQIIGALDRPTTGSVVIDGADTGACQARSWPPCVRRRSASYFSSST